MAIYRLILVKRFPECVPTTFRGIEYISFKKIRKINLIVKLFTELSVERHCSIKSYS